MVRLRCIVYQPSSLPQPPFSHRTDTATATETTTITTTVPPSVPRTTNCPCPGRHPGRLEPCRFNGPNGVHLHPFGTHLAPIDPLLCFACTQGSFRPLPVYAMPAMPRLPASLVRPPPLVFAPLQHTLPCCPTLVVPHHDDRPQYCALRRSTRPTRPLLRPLFSSPGPLRPPFGPSFSSPRAPPCPNPRNTSRNLHLHPSTPTPPILPYVSKFPPPFPDDFPRSRPSCKASAGLPLTQLDNPQYSSVSCDHPLGIFTLNTRPAHH